MKTMNRSAGWKVCLLALLTLPVMAQEEPADFKWEPQVIGKAEYIPLEQIRGFYGFDPIERRERELVLNTPEISMKLAMGSREIAINGTKLILQNEVKGKDGGAFLSKADVSGMIDPILRPEFIKEMWNFNTVVIDPGYGGKNQGVESAWGTAAEHSLVIARLVKAELEKRGLKVVMTREDDQDLLLKDRARIANGVDGATILINITFESGPKDRRGVSTSALASHGDRLAEEGQGLTNASVALGMAVHGSILRRLGKNTEDRGLGRTKYSVLSEAKCPRISVNAGYLTHPIDGINAGNDKYRDAIAKGVADGVLKYRSAANRKPR